MAKMICRAVVDDREEPVLLIIGVVTEEEVESQCVVEVRHRGNRAGTSDLGSGVCVADLALHRSGGLEDGRVASCQPEVS